MAQGTGYLGIALYLVPYAWCLMPLAYASFLGISSRSSLRDEHFFARMSDAFSETEVQFSKFEKKIFQKA
jgi:hypothetical protein